MAATQTQAGSASLTRPANRRSVLFAEATVAGRADTASWSR